MSQDIPPVAPTQDNQQAAIQLRDKSRPAYQLILGAFTRPGKAYFDRKDAIAIDLSLKKLATTHNLEEATDATKERLEVEESVDKELLDTIIRNEVKMKTQKINAELGQLKRQMALLTASQSSGPKESKNTRRGQPKSQGASTRKKKSTTKVSTPNPRTRNKDSAPQAGAPAKGTLRNSRGQSTTRGQQKNTRRKQK